MAMEFFTGGTRLGKPTAKLTTAGQIRLNVNASRILELDKGDKCWIMLGYDAKSKQIGIKRVVEGTPGRRSLNRSNCAGVIAAKKFFDHFELCHIDYDKYYDVIQDEQNEMLLIDLGE